MRHEWMRSGLPFYKANEAVGVKNAASRKYLASDWLWYFPPPEAMEKMAQYANENGLPTDYPYYSLDGIKPVTSAEWAKMRYDWTHTHALTNVWELPPLHGKERIRGSGKRMAPRVHRPTKQASAHLNQKPVEFMERIVRAATNEGDVIWEPFGGLCSASVAAVSLGRRARAAEIVSDFADIAEERVASILRP